MDEYDFAALSEALLASIQALGITRQGLLPLGGGHVQQTGILFTLAFIRHHLRTFF